ncbi:MULTISPECIES: YceH family protein [unclassified Symbiopectobacterium]|uniref:YceH family protein n=1 Tax=unclassified Symbiopectobacterium TaxID=2794573 RepID=UPI0022264041|nr:MULTISPECIES: YceH family protein [unclassified Symbiopectobacterium]MCW2473589.1 YceH family protein [Candidatus Symbiopectobacterium sp. NZEC151]MCW2484690.1 YceH family protein [Candidatus Symbiopectobacterium sp. NZEC127]
MKYQFDAKALRVVGCLLEKQITTPEQYPMSLNGVATACNQKTNREPVLDLSESEVQQTLDLLVKKHVVRTLSGFGNRVMKYEHRFCNSEFGNLKFSSAEVALVATLLLRGAQTPGELRTRAARLHEFADVDEVEQTLTLLQTREDGPFVVRLAREPGKREHRFMHLFGDDEPVATAADSAEERLETDSTDLAQRVRVLEQDVAELKQQLAHLLSQQS